MTALTDALDRAHWFPFPDNAAGYRGTGGYLQWKDDVAAIVAAARRVADAPEWLLCETHRCWPHPEDPIQDRCPLYAWEVEYTGDSTPCRMVRRLLVDPGDDT